MADLKLAAASSEARDRKLATQASAVAARSRAAQVHLLPGIVGQTLGIAVSSQKHSVSFGENSIWRI